MLQYAIVRKPGKNFYEGLTSQYLGKPDYNKALQQHNAYCEALRKCNLKLIVLEPDYKFPDGTFVEDTAIVTEKFAIITIPGDKSRQGEEEKIKNELCKFRKIEKIMFPGTVDGGDVLRIDNHFYIGISKRTNQDGARQLPSILSKYSFSSSTIPVKNVLHLKTGITYIGNNTLISIKEFSEKEEFKKFKIIEVDKDENYSVNCLLVNNTLLIPKGFPKTKEKLKVLDYNIIEIEMSEFRKMDGGLTCLSLLF